MLCWPVFLTLYHFAQAAKAGLARMRFYRNIEQAVRYWQPGKPFMHH
jgi:hypothetical protein